MNEISFYSALLEEIDDRATRELIKTIIEQHNQLVRKLNALESEIAALESRV